MSLLVALVAAVGASDPPPIPPGAFSIWPGTAPNETAGFPGPEAWVQDGSQVGCGPGWPNSDLQCRKIMNVSSPTLTPFLVTNGTGAAVVIAPGGGYTILAMDKEGFDVAQMWNRLGVSAFVLKYRVPARPDVEGLPKWWAPLQDAQRALSTVRHGAITGKWAAMGARINASRVGFSGFSAGGHLTAHVSTSWNARAYQPIDNTIDKVSCRPDFSVFLYPWYLLPNNKPAKWGAEYALADEFTGDEQFQNHPVSMFVHNADDPAAPVQGSLSYYGRILAESGLPKPTMHVFNSGGHGFGLCQGRQDNIEVCDWPKALQRFLQDHDLATGWPAKPSRQEMLTQNCEKQEL